MPAAMWCGHLFGSVRGSSLSHMLARLALSEILFVSGLWTVVLRGRVIAIEERNSSYKGTFLSAGDMGYVAPRRRKVDVKEIVQHMRQCRDELTRNVLILQQAALEQERTEQRFEGLAKVVDLFIEVVKKPLALSVVTEDWIRERDQIIMVLQEMLGEAQQNESQ